MSQLIDMIVHDLAQIDEGTLMKLKGSIACDLETGCVDHTKITDIEAPIATEDHELGLPKLFVVRNYKVIAVTFSNFVLGGVTVKANLEIF